MVFNLIVSQQIRDEFDAKKTRISPCFGHSEVGLDLQDHFLSAQVNGRRVGDEGRRIIDL